MKKIIKSVALIAVLSLAATGCQKENYNENGIPTEDVVAVHTVTYSIDGEMRHASFQTEQQWHDFLRWMFALAEEGHRVTFRNGGCFQNASTKKVITFETHSQEEAYSWAEAREKEGFEVSVTYDPHTGIYTCVAII